MKRIILFLFLLIASLSLSAMAESFESEFAAFKASVKSPSIFTASLSDAEISPASEISYGAYVKFTNFLVTESCKLYPLDYIVQNKSEVLQEVILKNLNVMYSGKHPDDIDRLVKNLYRVSITGFCVCLMEKTRAQ